jgi:hypothetical protein
MNKDSKDTGRQAPAPAMPELFTEEFLERRRQAMARITAYEGVDASDPKQPSGHPYGVKTSTRLTRQIKRTHRKQAMDISPQDVIDVLVAAGVKDWVLMGLHGYVGYMPMPRATQDVDVMVPYRQKKRAVKAIREAWPDLIVRELSQVVRFMDPGDLDPNGQPKPVIDLMLPWGKFQEMILKEYVVTEKVTQHRIPRLEAALAAKYASIISPHRDVQKKDYDAGDFRMIVRANYDRIQRDDLRRLAGEIWEGGADEIEDFVERANSGKPFPV